MATLCLLSFSPELLSLLADPGLDLERWQPLVELHFGAPKISYEPFPQLTFGTLVSAIVLLTRSLNHVSSFCMYFDVILCLFSLILWPT